MSFQLSQAKAGKLNPHVHVEYEWNLRQEEMDESDDDLDDKVKNSLGSNYYALNFGDDCTLSAPIIPPWSLKSEAQ